MRWYCFLYFDTRKVYIRTVDFKAHHLWWPKTTRTPCADVCSFSCPALGKSQTEADVIKKQMDGLAREYDRLLTEHQELQVMS